MKKNSLELKIYKTIFNMLLIVAIVVIGMIVHKYIGENENEKEGQDVVEAFSNIDFSEITEESKEQLEYKGYKVIGIVKIPKINIEYPIINQTSDETMALSITKFWGNNVNDIGNFTMAGHNYFDGTMFSNTNKLNIEDIIKMTDLDGKTIEYKVFDKYIIDPNDVKCVQSVKENTREITLITCINGRNNRLVVKARENI